MSDNVKLGQLLTGPEQRDAVHVAIAPVVAAEKLFSGQDIGFVDGTKERVGALANPIGIVDPFLKGVVQPEQRFWMCLYPNTITSLRHDWVHPAFEAATEPRTASEAWLKGFAEEFNLSYGKLIQAAQDWIDHKRYHTLNFDTPEQAFDKAEEFWQHFEVVTGKKVLDKTETFFTCAC